MLRGERYFEETESPSAVRTTGAGFGFHAGFFAGAFAAASAAAHATSSAHAAGRRRRDHGKTLIFCFHLIEIVTNIKANLIQKPF